MDEYKLRSWDRFTNTWVYITVSQKGFHIDMHDLLQAGGIKKNWARWLLFTGLKDKNGKEIWEGDILDDGGVIEFRNDLNWDSGGSIHSGFFSTKGYEFDPGCLSYHYQIVEKEVIGNIYETPDLIGDE